MDLILRQGCIFGRVDPAPADIGIEGGRIAAIEPHLEAEGPSIELDGRLVAPGLVETHIHLDKTCIIDRCNIVEGSLREAVAETGRAKRAFTEEDIYARAARTLEKCILNGTMLMRTHVEIDPGIGFRGLDTIRRLAKDYAWAVDIEICVFPQGGLTNYPGTEPLLIEALDRGARVIGAAPYTDTDPPAQIDRIFAIARDHDVDIDMHLDLGDAPQGMQIEHVCEQAMRHRYQGRVAVGHVTQLSTVPGSEFERIARRAAQAGVAVTVLPATDLYLTGRDQDHEVRRGVTAAHRLLALGVNCSLSTNNVLNPFTPYGDASLIRIANLYANVCHVGRVEDLVECFAMVTTRSAALMRRQSHGVEAGNRADLVVFDSRSAESAVAEVVPPLFGLKAGQPSFTRPRGTLRPRGASAGPEALGRLLSGET